MTAPLFIQHRAPYADYTAQDTLDALLVMAAFGQSPSVLFEGDGVWQLVGAQDTSTFGRASIVAQYGALDLYEVENVYVDLHSLRQRHLTLKDLAIDAQGLEQTQLADFISQHRFIIRL